MDQPDVIILSLLEGERGFGLRGSNLVDLNEKRQKFVVHNDLDQEIASAGKRLKVDTKYGII
jgi:hypothetical protein